MMPEPAKLREFAARYTAAWNSQDPASVAAFFSQDGSLSVNGDTPAVGRNAIAEVARGFMTAFPDLHLLMDNLVVRGGRVEYHWTFIGTNTGPGGTGHRVRFSGFEVWKIGDDGLVAESQGHFDSADHAKEHVEGLRIVLMHHVARQFRNHTNRRCCRHEDLGGKNRHDAQKILGPDADDGRCLPVDADRPAHGVRFGIHALLPETVADENHGSGSGLVETGVEQPAARRAHADHRQVLGRNHVAKNAIGFCTRGALEGYVERRGS
jgi:predicted ester cyclase